jgi:hypothetical protein
VALHDILVIAITRINNFINDDLSQSSKFRFPRHNLDAEKITRGSAAIKAIDF